MPDNDKLREAAKRLLKFKLERTVNKDRFPDFFGGYYGEGDENAPFFSERFLYPMFGKEDARTILALVNTVIRKSGLDLLEIEVELSREYDNEN